MKRIVGTKKLKPAGISEKVIRLLDVYALIAQGHYPSIQALRERFRVTDRTIYRYLELINLIDPIDYDATRHGYFFTSGDRLKRPLLTGDELAILFAAGEAVSHLGKPFQEAFQAIVSRLLVPRGRAASKRPPPIIVKGADAICDENLGKILNIILDCVEEHRSAEITYKAQQTKEVTERIVDPYGLVFHEGVWILVGFCHLRRQIRSFALDRILKLKERHLLFTPQKGFDLKEYLSASWGVIDDKLVRITVRFDREARDYVLRKKRWHPSERRKELPDGDVELSFAVAGIVEIKRWIYSWLPHARVTKPLWLKKQIEQELRQALKAHVQGR